MLKGSINILGNLYNLEGYDFGYSVDLKIYPSTFKSQIYIDKGYYVSEDDFEYPTWDNLWVSIGSGVIKVDKYDTKRTITVDGTSKVIKLENRINQDALGALGEIIEGMKQGACTANLESSDVDLYNSGFNPQAVYSYVYDNGRVSLRSSRIESIHYKDENIELHMEEDYTYECQIHPNTKAHYRVKLDLSDFLTSYNIESDEMWDTGEDVLYTFEEIIEQHPEKDYSWLRNQKYYMVREDNLEEVCKYLNQFKLLAFDTETTGLNINITSRRGEGDRLVGLIFSVEEGIAYYFPIAHKKFKNICTPDTESYIIDRYFRHLLENKNILTFNGSFDWRVMHIYNICINITEDVYIMWKVTEGNRDPNAKSGLKDLEKRILHRDSFKLSDFTSGKFGENYKFWDFDEQSVLYYACPDTDCLLSIFNELTRIKFLEQFDAKKIYEIEVKFSIVIAYQEFYGHHVDMDKYDQLVKDLDNEIESTYNEMVKIVGHDFNPKSPKELPKVMFEELEMPVQGRTPAGNYSTDKDTRKALMNMTNPDGSPKYPFVFFLNDYLDAKTLKSNFTNKIAEISTPDGYMFSSVEQFLATGRVSTSNPNYQGYSKTVKKYVGPREGYYGIDADYSTVEARIMCSMAGCTGMVKKLNDPDTDYHRQKAADMNKVAYELVSDVMRQMAKGVNFGILYGLGNPNLGANLYGYKSPENTKKAAYMKELYYVGMEELKPFTEVSREQGITQGFSTTFFGRRRYYDSAKVRKDTIERQSCNARIQGTAADLYKLGMVRLFEEIKRRGWVGLYLISAFVHDEFFGEVHKSINPFEALKVAREAMMIEIEGWCPLFTGMGLGSTWYEAKSGEIPVQVQESLIERYAENCPSWWDGNTEKLVSFVSNEIYQYKINRVLSYLSNNDNWGKVLMPVESQLIHSVLKDIKSGASVPGVVSTEWELSKDTIESVNAFLDCFGRSELKDKVNIQVLQETVQTTVNLPVSNEEEEVEYSSEDVIKLRTNTMGVFLDSSSSSKKLYLKLVNDNAFMNLVFSNLVKFPGDICVYVITPNGTTILKNKQTGEPVTVNIKVYQAIIKLYLNKKNMGGI